MPESRRVERSQHHPSVPSGSQPRRRRRTRCRQAGASIQPPAHSTACLGAAPRTCAALALGAGGEAKQRTASGPGPCSHLPLPRPPPARPRRGQPPRSSGAAAKGSYRRGDSLACRLAGTACPALGNGLWAWRDAAADRRGGQAIAAKAAVIPACVIMRKPPKALFQRGFACVAPPPCLLSPGPFGHMCVACCRNLVFSLSISYASVPPSACGFGEQSWRDRIVSCRFVFCVHHARRRGRARR